MLGVRPVLVPSLSFAPQPIWKCDSWLSWCSEDTWICMRVLAVFVCLLRRRRQGFEAQVQLRCLFVSDQPARQRVLSRLRTEYNVEARHASFETENDWDLLQISAECVTRSERSPSVNVVSPVPCGFLQVGECAYAVEVSCMDLMRLRSFHAESTPRNSRNMSQ